VEENNFGIRKRLLEYDDVMNKQRTVIYTKRNHALFGERLALDLDNSFYDVADGLVNTFKERNDYEGFKLETIVNLGLDTVITKEEFEKGDEQQLIPRLYEEAMMNYQRKRKDLAQTALPVFKSIRETQGLQIQNVAVPFTDGRRGIQVLTNLDKVLQTSGMELANMLERSTTLSLIDDAWKEHLRAMDDLKQSVQTAHYEQKDPLVIYKGEAFNLFRQMNGEVSTNIVSFLSHAELPVQQNAPMREARQERTDMSKMHSNKREIDNTGQDYAANENDYYDPTPVKKEPVRVGPKIGRNDPCPCGSGKKYKNCHGRDE
jgi:preprotein translocase subunit SecA